ncbi:MAG TPA: hypothetical protein ENK66_08820 [Arcobacter sp.]|nr:hypothetical protein [Arcobacter sp.]
MNPYKNTRSFLFLLSTVIILNACGGGSTSENITQTSLEVSNITSSAIHEGKLIDNTTGKPIENVTVTVEGQTTTTDKNGMYKFTNLAETENAIVNFNKDGYQIGSKAIKIKSTTHNFVEYHMNKHNYQWDIENLEEFSSPSVAIELNAFTNINKTSLNDTISIHLTILNNDDEALLNTFPGKFEGIDTNGANVKFITYGLIAVKFNDSRGNSLDLDEGETATLTFKALTTVGKPQTLPLWYYDYKQGLWFEKGSAQLQENGTYKGDISHLGTWAINKPIENESAMYKGHIVDENDQPMSNARLIAKGDNWVTYDLSTDENGLFEIEVIPDSSFYLSAYNYEEKYSASYDTKMLPIASGNVVED